MISECKLHAAYPRTAHYTITTDTSSTYVKIRNDPHSLNSHQCHPVQNVNHAAAGFMSLHLLQLTLS